MQTLTYVYYQEEDMWVGWLEDFPDYRTQGETVEELEENLRDIQQELTSGRIPCVRRVGKLTIQ
jgi:predicted RNase H-like HicB family nuclease